MKGLPRLESHLFDDSPETSRHTTAGGIPIRFRVGQSVGQSVESLAAGDRAKLSLHLDHARLRLLRGFDQLLCLEGLDGVEHLPHQIETVRKALRHFRGRVLLADEVGLGKTIEACLLLREYLLRNLVRRVLILVPAPLVSQWDEELRCKFHLEFTIPGQNGSGQESSGRKGKSNPETFWNQTDRVLTSLSYAKSKKRAHLVTAAPWDLVIVDEAHHCKNRSTLNWKLVNSLQRKHMFLLTATPVQNNLIELYNLLTLLEPGHLRTEGDFKKRYVRRGNPRAPLHREQLRSLLGEVMIRNTRSLVQMDLPPRYAQTILAQPGERESLLYRELAEFLRMRQPQRPAQPVVEEPVVEEPVVEEPVVEEPAESLSPPPGEDRLADAGTGGPSPRLTRMQLSALLAAQGSHPAALAYSLRRAAESDDTARRLVAQAGEIHRSAKDDKLLELIRNSQGHRILVFVNFLRTLHRLEVLLEGEGIGFSTFSGEQSSRKKDEAVEAFRDKVSVMLCTDSGGEGRNLQFADTLVNYDLPWNPMKIEQRVGRVHRIGQTQDVFVFNLCTVGSLEDRILRLLTEKIRMFELVVGEVGSILGNLDEGQEFETLVLNLWMRSQDDNQLGESFENLGDSLLEAQEQYVQAKELDDTLFGEDYE